MEAEWKNRDAQIVTIYITLIIVPRCQMKMFEKFQESWPATE